MITEVYFIEGLYLYTEVGSSGRGDEQGSQVPLAVHVCQKDTSEGCVAGRRIGGGYFR